MNSIANCSKVVIKVGTSTITYKNGKLNLRHLECLCKVISELQNSGKKIVLVSSGAIGVGIGKLGLSHRPENTAKKQALAAVGQCELMFMYDKFFGEYNHTVAQILLTPDVIDNLVSRKNVENTFKELFDLDIIPIVNENDTVAVDELEGKNFGDNDTLSAIVATLINAEALIILTDTNGLYTANPNEDPNAILIPVVDKITADIEALAGDSASTQGTGGMITKLEAAKIANSHGILCSIINGDNPENLYKLFNGINIGTLFTVWNATKEETL